jgi:hypothetical protein
MQEPNKYQKLERPQDFRLPSKNNLRNYNLNRTAAALERRILVLREYIIQSQQRNDRPAIRRFNRNNYNTRQLLEEVRRRKNLQGARLTRFFSSKNLARHNNALSKFGGGPETFHLYTNELERLRRKYRVPGTGSGPWNLVSLLVTQNQNARNQIARNYALHWHARAQNRLFKTRQVGPRVIQQWRAFVQRRKAASANRKRKHNT